MRFYVARFPDVVLNLLHHRVASYNVPGILPYMIVLDILVLHLDVVDPSSVCPVHKQGRILVIVYCCDCGCTSFYENWAISSVNEELNSFLSKDR